jgi:hypothetical protein
MKIMNIEIQIEGRVTLILQWAEPEYMNFSPQLHFCDRNPRLDYHFFFLPLLLQ